MTEKQLNEALKLQSKIESLQYQKFKFDNNDVSFGDGNIILSTNAQKKIIDIIKEDTNAQLKIVLKEFDSI